MINFIFTLLENHQLMTEYNDQFISVNSLDSEELKSPKDNTLSKFVLYVENIQTLEENFEILFDKNYFYLYDQIVLFYNYKLSANSLNKLLNSHGYENPILLGLDTNSSNVTVFNIRSNKQHNICNESLLSLVLNPDFFVLIKSEVEAEKLYDEFHFFCNSHPLGKMVIKHITELEMRMIKSNHLVKWQQNTINNYKTYLKVLKELVRKNSSLAFHLGNNKLIKLLKKSNFLRKYGRKILSKSIKR